MDLLARVSIGLVDAHPLLLRGVSQLFAAHDRFHVVGTGHTAEEAIEIVRDQHPDLLIMDCNFGGYAIDALGEIASTSSTKLVIFTELVSVEDAVQAFELGAQGYVLKTASSDELLRAIETILRGESFIDPSIALKVIAALRQKATQRTPSRILLSDREQEMVQLLLLGHTNREIAESLSLSEKLVKKRMTTLMQKLNVRSRLEVVLVSGKSQSGVSTKPSPTELN